MARGHFATRKNTARPPEKWIILFRVDSIVPSYLRGTLQGGAVHSFSRSTWLQVKMKHCPAKRLLEAGRRTGLTGFALAWTRTLTSIVRIEGGIHPLLSGQDLGEIPKRLIIQAMNLLKKSASALRWPPGGGGSGISAERVWTGLPQRICRQSRRSTAPGPRNQTVPGPLLR